MKILIVSQYFWPENFRVNDLTVQLQKLGHEVKVLTGYPNYPEGEFFSDFLKDRSKFSNYHGAEVVRLPIVARGKRKITLALNYLSFIVSGILLAPFKMRSSDFDVIFVFGTSPIFQAIPAIWLKWLYKKPLTLWVLDLWPQSLEAVGVMKNKSILHLISKAVVWLYNRCDIVYGQSHSFVEEIKNLGVKSQVKYLPSWSDNIANQNIAQGLPNLSQFTNKFKILFTGNIGEAQDFPSLLNAIVLIKALNLPLVFLIVGDGRKKEWLSHEIRRLNLEDYINLLGRYELSSMHYFYNQADALYLSLRDEKIFSYTIPGKFQSYLAAKKPLIGMISGEANQLIKQFDLGWAVEAEDCKGLAAFIPEIIQTPKDRKEEMGRNCERLLDSEFNSQKIIQKLSSDFKYLTDSVQN